MPQHGFGVVLFLHISCLTKEVFLRMTQIREKNPNLDGENESGGQILCRSLSASQQALLGSHHSSEARLLGQVV